MGSTEKMRDEEGRVKKASQPDNREIICPFVFKASGQAVNYDLRWVSQRKFVASDEEGYWVSTPFTRRGHGPLARDLYDKMRAMDPRPAAVDDDNKEGFAFSHETGKAARVAYIQKVCRGELKAHKGSWGPNLDRTADKSRFRFLVPIDLAQECKLEYLEINEENASQIPPLMQGDKNEPQIIPVMEAKERFPGLIGDVHVPYSSLMQRYPDLYRTTPTYVPKGKKIEFIKSFFESDESLGTLQEFDITNQEHLRMVAQSTHLNPSDVRTVIAELRTESNIDQQETTKEEVAPVQEDELSFEDVDVAAAEAMESVAEVAHVDLDEVDEELDEQDLAEIEQTLSQSEVATAAVTATEPPMPATETEPKQEVTERRYVTHDLSGITPIRARMFSDASKQRIPLEKGIESIDIQQNDGTRAQHYLCYVPDLDVERFLPAGQHLLGDAETGRCYLVNVEVVDVGGGDSGRTVETESE